MRLSDDRFDITLACVKSAWASINRRRWVGAQAISVTDEYVAVLSEDLALMAHENLYLGRVQVLRFFAATSVLFAHLQHEVQNRLMPQVPFRSFEWIDGGVGVDLFFVISGFIMYHVAGDKFGRPGAARAFLIRRFLRIAPLYYMATALMIAATLTFSGAVSIAEPEATHVISSFLFLPAVNRLGELVPVLKLGWTLNFEVYFYLVFAAALAFPRRIGLLVLAAVLGSMALLAQVLASPPAAIAFWGQPLVFEFLGGIGIALLYRRGVRLGAVPAVVLICAGLALLAGLRGLGLNAYLTRALFDGVPAWLIVFAVVMGPFDRHRGALQRFLEAGGEASYAIYVMHPFGIRAGALLWQRMGGPELPWLYIGAMMVVVILGAWAVNVLVERPLDRWLRSMIESTPRPRTEAAVSGA